MKPRTYQNLVFYHNGREMLFPFFIPVLVGYFRLFPGDAVLLRQNPQQLQLADNLLPEIRSPDVGFKSVLRIYESVILEGSQFTNQGIGDVFGKGRYMECEFSVCFHLLFVYEYS